MSLISTWREMDEAAFKARWPHFSPRELACRCNGRFCAGEYWHDPGFLDAMSALRLALGGPVRVNSGHRCALWNAHVGGAPLSQHKKIAVDVALAGHDPVRMFHAAQAAGFSGRGLYQGFIHLDRGPMRRWYGGKIAEDLWQNWLKSDHGSASKPA